MPKQVLAVVVGFVLWSAVWLGYNAALQAMGMLPTDQAQPIRETPVLLALLVGSVSASLLAGYVAAATAKLAARPAVIALGLLLIATGSFVQVQYWNLMPVWYHLSFLALLLPTCIVGEKFRKPKTGT